MTSLLRVMSLNLLFVLAVVAQTQTDPSDLETRLKAQGLIDIHTLAQDILVELKYSTTDNFLHADTYGDLEACYLQPEAAAMLAEAQKFLHLEHPELTLLVYDAARPRSIQRKMWALVAGTDVQEYVANPENGSVHNFGSAVDLTVATRDGQPLDMGTAFDFFGDLAQPRFEAKFLAQGQLTQEQINNREILRSAMTRAGFHPLRMEWWHFNAFPVKEARAKYRIIE